MIKRLGHGASGYVKEVIHVPSGEVMAIKVVNMSSEAVSRENLCRELNTMRYAEFPSFLDFYGATLFVSMFVSLHPRVALSC